MDASERGLLGMGIAEVVKPGTSTVIGHVLATTDTGGTRVEGDGAQLQRWHLFEATNNDFEVRPAPPEWTSLSLADWQEKARTTWRRGHRYIHTRARIYVYGGVYGRVEWTSLPTSARQMPFVQFPDVLPPKYQIDVTGGRVLGMRQETIEGVAVAFATDNPAVTVEYWCTNGSFSPAGRSARAAMTPNGQTVTSVDDYLRLAAPYWTRGAALSVVGCVQFEGDTCPPTL